MFRRHDRRIKEDRGRQVGYVVITYKLSTLINKDHGIIILIRYCITKYQARGLAM